MISLRRAPIARHRTRRAWWNVARRRGALVVPGLRRAGHHELRLAGVPAGERVEERQPVAEQPRRQEAAAHELLATEATLPGTRRIVEDRAHRRRTLRRRVDEPAGLAVEHLRDE